MLARILTTMRAADRPLCLADLGRLLDIDEPALEGMLETLVARGRLRVVELDHPGCGGCPARAGCFIMEVATARAYALTVSERTAADGHGVRADRRDGHSTAPHRHTSGPAAMEVGARG